MVTETRTDADWDAYVRERARATAYHFSGWPRLIARACGHEARLLAAERNGRITGVLPLVLMRSRLFGRFAVSLPFLNAGGILADDEESAAALFAEASAVAQEARVRYLELRHTRVHFPQLEARRHKVGMALALAHSAEEQWKALDRKVRNQIRKAEKSSLTVADGLVDRLEDFYGVFARNMRDLGTPVFGFRLFEEALRTFPDNTRVVCVEQRQRPVAAAIVHWRGPSIEVIWASALREANAVCANSFLYWHLLRFAIDRGCRVFEFGRCTPGEGPFRFKQQWGAEPYPLVWEYWTPDGRPRPDDLNPRSSGFSRAANVWRHIPVSLATAVGPHIVHRIPC
jgi:FemAB-related protein (PEP-CTERM system-associated)